MLKELFLLDGGKPLLHYSPDTDLEDRDEAILASGFFSAISSFLQESRSSNVDKFSSESEVFVFHTMDQYDLEIVGVFDNHIRDNVARQFVKNLELELSKTDFIKSRDNDAISEEKIEFKKRIPDIQAAILQGQTQVEIIQDLVTNKPEIMLGIMYDLEAKTKLWHYANPTSLYNSDLLNQLNLIDNVVSNLMTKVYAEAAYRQVSINSSKYTITVFKNVDILYMLMGDINADLHEFIPELAHLSKLEVENDKIIEVLLEGSKIDILPNNYPAITAVLFSTLINNLNNFVNKTLKRSEFNKARIVFEHTRKLKEIAIKFYNDKYLIELPSF